MSTANRASLARRALASASLGASAAGIASLAFQGGHLWDGLVLGAAGVIGLGAAGLSRRAVLAQVFSRGVAWVVLTPALVGLAEAVVRRHLPDAYTLFFAATSGGALLLARPALHTDEAQAEFYPVGYRRTFLAGAVASVTTGTVLSFFAAELAMVMPGPALGLATLGAALFAAAFGVVRMRSWGVLLAMLTAVVALGAAALGSPLMTGLALAAIPGALLAAPLVVARLRGPAARRPAPVGTGRLFDERIESLPPVRARIDEVEELARADDAPTELARAVRVATGDPR